MGAVIAVREGRLGAALRGFPLLTVDVDVGGCIPVLLRMPRGLGMDGQQQKHHLPVDIRTRSVLPCLSRLRTGRHKYKF